MSDTLDEIDLSERQAWAVAEAKMLADSGQGEGTTYADRLASLLPECRRRAELIESDPFPARE